MNIRDQLLAEIFRTRRIIDNYKVEQLKFMRIRNGFTIFLTLIFLSLSIFSISDKSNVVSLFGIPDNGTVFIIFYIVYIAIQSWVFIVKVGINRINTSDFLSIDELKNKLDSLKQELDNRIESRLRSSASNLALLITLTIGFSYHWIYYAIRNGKFNFDLTQVINPEVPLVLFIFFICINFVQIVFGIKLRPPRVSREQLNLLGKIKYSYIDYIDASNFNPENNK